MEPLPFSLSIPLTEKVETILTQIKSKYPSKKDSNIKLIHKGKTLAPFRIIHDEGIIENDLIMFVEVVRRKQEENPKYSTPEYQTIIGELMEYGYNREEVVEAMIHANDDRDLAMQFLDEVLLSYTNARDFQKTAMIPMMR